MMRKLVLPLVMGVALLAHGAAAKPAAPSPAPSSVARTPQPPSIAFGPLFRAVQLKEVFPDQKTFVDLVPKTPPQAILSTYERAALAPGLRPRELRQPALRHGVARADGEAGAAWPVLSQLHRGFMGRADGAGPEGPASRLAPAAARPLRRARRPVQRALYYWDSYFTELGLEQDRRYALTRAMVRDFAFELDTYGHVPNGNRTYYLSRSQPPFFAAMLDLIAAHDGDRVYHGLPARAAHRVRLLDGRCGRPRQGHSTPPRGPSRRRRAPQPVLGRPQRAARRILPGGRRPPPGWQSARRRRSTATCARRPNRAGISAHAGSPTTRTSRPSARPP